MQQASGSALPCEFERALSDDRDCGSDHPIAPATRQRADAVVDLFVRHTQRYRANGLKPSPLLLRQDDFQRAERLLELHCGARAKNRNEGRRRPLCPCKQLGDRDLRCAAVELPRDLQHNVEQGRLPDVDSTCTSTPSFVSRPTSPWRYLPVSRPPPNGDQRAAPKPSASAMGKSSRSGVVPPSCTRAGYRPAVPSL